MLMRPVETTQDPMQWYAVRVKRRQAGGIRTALTGGKFETYRDRAGQLRKRRVKGTGTKVFLPEHLLRRAGFEVFLPVKKVMRLKNRFTREKHMVAQPLLVDWLFVGWPAHENRWHQLQALDVVSGVLGTGGGPAAIAPPMIRKLMEMWGGGMLSAECHRYAKTGCSFEPGDSAYILNGPFEGLPVKVVDIRGPSVRGLLKIFGAEQEIEINHLLLSPTLPDLVPATAG